MNVIKPSSSAIFFFNLTSGGPTEQLQNPRMDWSQSISSSVFSLPCSFFSFLRLRSSFLEATFRLFSPFGSYILLDWPVQFLFLSLSYLGDALMFVYIHFLITSFPLMLGPPLLWSFSTFLRAPCPHLMDLFMTGLMGSGTVSWEVLVTSRLYTVWAIIVFLLTKVQGYWLLWEIVPGVLAVVQRVYSQPAVVSW